MAKKKVLLKGPTLVLAGYGHHSRTVLRSLRAYEDVFDIYVEPLNWGHCSWLHTDDEERKYIDSLVMKTAQYHQVSNGNPEYDIIAHVSILGEFEKKGSARIVGITAGVESNKISPQWLERTQVCNNIITISEHAKNGIVNTTYEAKDQFGNVVKDFKCQTPVKVIGYPANAFEPEPFPELEQIDTDFNFLTICQWSPRKNLETLISSFIEEHHDNSNVGLVLKVNLAANSIIDRTHTENRLQYNLSKYPDKKCKIYLIHGDLTENNLAALYLHPKIKAYVSVGPEGFCLPAFDATLYGMPVITMPWGGYTEYLYMPMKSSKGKEYNKAMFAEIDWELKKIPQEAVWDGVLVADSSWGVVKPGSLKVRMRDVRGSYQKYKDMALKLQEHNLDKFNEEKIYAAYASEILGEPIKRVTIEELPGVSLFTSVFRSKLYLENFFQEMSKQTIFNKCEILLGHPKTSPDFEEEKKIIDRYMAKHSNISYYELEEDPGLYGVWNYLIPKTKYDIISNANTDDVRSYDCLEKCSRELYLNPEVDSLYFDQKITNVPNQNFYENSSEGRQYTFAEYSFAYLKMMNLTFHAMPVYRKSMHDRWGMYDAKYKSSGDWCFALTCGAGGAKFKKMGEVLGLYLFNEVGISTNPANFSWKQLEEKEVFEKFKDINL